MKDLSLQDYEALAGFRYALRKFLRFSKTTLANEAELTSEQYEALLAVRAFGEPDGLNIAELSERLQVRHHTAVSLVAKLVARRLITRKSPDHDRRYVNLRLTDAGATLLTRLAAIHRREMRSRSGEMIEALLKLQK